jgi:TonB family protein
MTTHDSPLERIRIAAPCKAEWKWMYGNDRVRFCGQCSLNVFNLSAMTREEAEDLIRRNDGNLCVRFYRRKDGTILTSNCPVGLRAIRHRFTRTKTHIAAAIFSFFAYLGLLGAYKVVDHQLNTMDDRVLNSYAGPTMGLMALPLTAPEESIRARAVYEVTPIYHSYSKNPVDVVVRIEVNEAGEVEGASILDETSPLRELAEGAARRWRFEPVLVDGRPAKVQSSLTFHFKN